MLRALRCGPPWAAVRVELPQVNARVRIEACSGRLVGHV